MTDGANYRITYQRWLGWYWMWLPETGDQALQGPFATEQEAFDDMWEHIEERP